MQIFTLLLFLLCFGKDIDTNSTTKALSNSENAVGMLRDNYLAEPVGHHTRFFFRQGLVSWCDKKSRFSMKTFDPVLQRDKLHQIRTEEAMQTIPLRHPNSMICVVRSTKAMVPKGNRYAFKFSIEALDDEVRVMRKLAEQGHITKAIRCKFDCMLGILQIPIVRVTRIWGRSTRRETVNVDFNLFPMEHFEASTLSDFLTSFSKGIPISETDMRAGLLHTPAVFQAYQTTKKSILEYFSASWIHRDLTVLNILYSRQQDDIRIINLEDAENFDEVRSSGNQMSPLEWMGLVADDFRSFSASFALSIFCPEDFAQETTYNADDCIPDEEIGFRMSQFDEDFRMISTFLLNDPSEQRLDQLPQAFQLISRSLGRDFVPGGAPSAAEEQTPPGYHSLDDVLGLGGLLRETSYDASNQAGPSTLGMQDSSSQPGPSADNGDVSPLRAHMLEMHLESASSHSSSSNAPPEEHVSKSYSGNISWQHIVSTFFFAMICFIGFKHCTFKEDWEVESFYQEADL